MNTCITLQALALSALLTTPAAASDHLDTQAVIADPAADIEDLHSWVSPDGRRLSLAMTIAGKTFSDHVRYAFRVDSGQPPHQTSATSTIECDFNSAVAPQCRLDGLDIARRDVRIDCGALVIEVDISAVNHGELLSGVWATTTVRAALPGNPPLEEGVVIDRMGRALTELSTGVGAELGRCYAVQLPERSREVAVTRESDILGKA